MAAVGAQLDDVVGGFLVFVGNGVGTDLLQLGLHPAVDGVVIGGKFHRRFLARVQERDVLRADLRLDQQGVVQRHDFHQVAAWLDNPANGIDQQLVDDTPHRRGDQRPADPVFQGLAGGLGLVQVGACFIELGQGFATELATGFIDLALHFLDCRFGSWNCQRGGVELTTGLRFGTPEAQDFHRRYRALGHQRLGHADFLTLEAQLLAILRLFGGEFAQLLLALDQLLLQATNLIVQLLATTDIERFFTLGLTRHGLEHILGEVQRAIFDLGAQALDPQQHRQPIGLGFTDVRSKSRVVQANQRCAGFDNLTFLDEQLGNDTAFKVLDLLDLRRWNRLAVALGHLVDHREVGPEHQEHKERDDRPDRQPHHAGRILDQRLVDLRQRLPLK
ncbi:hypothetical protein D3C71_1107010 [compost metagenome]